MEELDPRLERLGAAIAEADAPDAAAIAQARRRFLGGTSAPRRVVTFPRVALAAAAAALIALGGWWWLDGATPTAPTPGYAVEGGGAGPEGWLSSGEAPVRVRFEDGSRVVMAPSARARVAEVRADGATVQLEGGTLDVAVVHRDDTRWAVRAGPYRIDVTGTRFEVQWDPGPERLTVQLTEGSVRVSGPLLDPPRRVSAGQTLVADAAEVSLRTGERAPTPAPPAAPAADPEPLAQADDEPAPAVRGDAAELWAAADRARYEGRAADARRALLRLRRVHRERGRTSFLLGTIAAQRGDRAEAARWFETYLSEHPSGPLAEPALGRLVELSRTPAAARRYLARYPDGAHAPLARTLASPD